MNDRPPSRRRAGGTLEVQSLIPRARVRKDFLTACARHSTRHIRSKIGQLNFVIVDDRYMSRLHRTYTGIRGTTDVLTFDLSDSREYVDGDIVICLDQARRQAKLYRVPLYEEVARLAVHGVLHLAGYKDSTPAERDKMHQLEDRSLMAGRRA